MKKIFKMAHLWLSLPFGIFISVMCLTGGLLVYQNQLIHLFDHDRYYVKEVKGEPLPLETLIPMVHEAYPQWPLEAVEIHKDDPTRAYHFDFETAKNTSVQVDPYTGKAISVIFPGYDGFSATDVFFDVVQRLHTNFLFGSTRGQFAWGPFLTGTITIIFFFVIVSGIVIWAPKKLKNIKDRLKVNTKKGGFRFWYDLHLSGGILAAIFLLLMALSGPDFAFDWYHNGVLALFGGKAEQTQQVQRPARQPQQQGRLDLENTEDLKTVGKSCDFLEQQFEALYPDSPILKFKFGGTSFVTIKEGRARVQVNFDNKTGEIKEINTPDIQSPALKAETLIDYLHTGDWAGNFSKILYVLAALIGTISPITGYYFYFRKKLKKSKGKK